MRFPASLFPVLPEPKIRTPPVPFPEISSLRRRGSADEISRADDVHADPAERRRTRRIGPDEIALDHVVVAEQHEVDRAASGRRDDVAGGGCAPPIVLLEEKTRTPLQPLPLPASRLIGSMKLPATVLPVAVS
jgi:hypothetical protein